MRREVLDAARRTVLASSRSSRVRRSQQPTGRPGVRGSRWPWKSLNASSWTRVVVVLRRPRPRRLRHSDRDEEPTAKSTRAVIRPRAALPLFDGDRTRRDASRSPCEVVTPWRRPRSSPTPTSTASARVERVGADHLLAHELADGARLDLGHLEQELVVHLEHEPGGAALAFGAARGSAPSPP